MNYVKLSLPKRYTFSPPQWHDLQEGLRTLAHHSPITYYHELDSDHSLLMHPLHRESGAFLLTATDMNYDLEYQCEDGPETHDLLMFCLYVNHVSHGKIKISSTLHRKRTLWEQAAADLKTRLHFPMGSFTLPQVSRLLPTNLGSA